jgi:hypothetical protein
MAREYEYRARDIKGQLFTGLVLADDEASAAGHVRNKGLFVTQVREAKSRQDIGVLLRNRRPIKTRDLSIFCRQFATMIESGLPILTCLNVLAEQTENPRLRDTLKVVYKRVQEGTALAQALKEIPGVFPDIMVSMVAAGELGGVLEVVMQRLAIHFEKEHRLNEKVKAAMTYPIVVMFDGGGGGHLCADVRAADLHRHLSVHECRAAIAHPLAGRRERFFDPALVAAAAGCGGRSLGDPACVAVSWPQSGAGPVCAADAGLRHADPQNRRGPFHPDPGQPDPRRRTAAGGAGSGEERHRQRDHRRSTVGLAGKPH